MSESERAAYTIGEAAERSGLSEDTIRYYEKIGLLPPPQRRANNHRVYRADDVEKMILVGCLKITGISLEEMKPFLRMSLRDDLTKFPDLHEKIMQHKAAILEQIASLQQVIDFIDNKMSSIGSDKDAECTVRKPYATKTFYR